MLPLREPESYISSPSRVYASSPVGPRSSEMFSVAWANGNVGSSDMNNGTGLLSPRALSQKELSDAILRGVVDGISRLGLLEKQTEVIESIRRLPSSHSEVLEAITNVTVDQPNLTPILEAISRQSNHKEMNIVVDPPDLSPLQQMMEEMKVEIRESMANIRSDLQSDMSILQQEVLKNRELILEAHRKIECVATHEEHVQVLAALRRIPDNSEVLNSTRTLGVAVEDVQSLVDSLQRRVSNLDFNPIMQEISKTSSVSDTRLAGLQREIWQLRDGLAAVKVVIPPTQTMVNQAIQPSATMQRVMAVPGVVPSQVVCAGAQELINASPRVIVPSVPLTGTVQMKVVPAGYPQEALAPSAMEVTMTESLASDGYVSPRQEFPYQRRSGRFPSSGNL